MTLKLAKQYTVLSTYIIAIIVLTPRHLDPILHYTYDRTCSSASMFYHLPYARYAPSSCYHTDSIPAYLSTSQPLTHIYDCNNFDLFRSLHHLRCLSGSSSSNSDNWSVVRGSKHFSHDSPVSGGCADVVVAR